MRTLQETLHGVLDVINPLGIPYAVIGGMANFRWGETRNTIDVDLLLWVKSSDLNQLFRALEQHYRFRVPDVETFAKNAHMIPLITHQGVGIDLVLGELPYQKGVIDRAVEVEVLGRLARICTVEDLIILKIVSDRARDQDDVEKILCRRINEIDASYVEDKLRELSVPGDESTLRKWHKLKDEALDLERRREEERAREK